jgi:hypothetical protein
MGFQIPGPTTGKVQYLIDMYQAVVLDRPPRNFTEIPDHQAIICVVDTIQYEVASYAFSRQEFSLLDDRSDFRKRTWLLMEKARANELSGFGIYEILHFARGGTWNLKSHNSTLLGLAVSPSRAFRQGSCSRTITSRRQIR